MKVSAGRNEQHGSFSRYENLSNFWQVDFRLADVPLSANFAPDLRRRGGFASARSRWFTCCGAPHDD
jgi:hypothetical protein